MKQTIIYASSIIFILLGILFQTVIGICYQQMIQATDNLSSTKNKLLMQCKDRFVKCHTLNGGVSNVSAFVDKYVNRIKFMGLTMNALKNLSTQFTLFGVLIAGFGICSGLISGIRFIELLPYYIISLFGIYLFLSVMSVVDSTQRKQVLKANLTDYLENHIAKRLEHGMQDKAALYEHKEKEQNRSQSEETPKKIFSNPSLSEEDMQELQELLKSLLV